jgi:hypothetical protein
VDIVTGIVINLYRSSIWSLLQAGVFRLY